jgi:hypothetical protein
MNQAIVAVIGLAGLTFEPFLRTISSEADQSRAARARRR